MTVNGERRKRTEIRKKTEKRSRQGFRKAFCFKMVLLVIVGGIAVGAVYKRYAPTKERADLSEYYGISKENDLAVVIGNQIIKETQEEEEKAPGFLEAQVAYVSYEAIHDFLNERFYWDEQEQILMYTLPESIVKVRAEEKSYTVGEEKEQTDYTVVRLIEGTPYLALEFVKTYTDGMEFTLYEEPARVVIETQTDETIETAKISRKTAVRYRGGVKSPILCEVSSGDTVTVLETEGDWIKIATRDGFIGYVKDSKLKDRENIIEESAPSQETEYSHILKEYQICMMFDNVTNQTANDKVLERLAESKGVNTIAPTWFTVADTSGNLFSLASSQYVEAVHSYGNGLEVWATVRDFDSENGINSSDETGELLKNTAAREKLTANLISIAQEVDLDGLNVDFEKVPETNAEDYIQFIRELSVACRKAGIVLSIDNYVPKSYNDYYNRQEQAAMADYVVIMGYDEHTYGSTESGSVASYNFVKEGIEDTLEQVPKEQVINAIPFYTRVWAENGTQLDFTVYNMEGARQAVAAAGAEATWDETTKQNYAQWEENGITYKVWLEDADSVQEKLSLMSRYDIAGMAAWRLGQEETAVWDVILEYVQN